MIPGAPVIEHWPTIERLEAAFWERVGPCEWREEDVIEPVTLDTVFGCECGRLFAIREGWAELFSIEGGDKGFAVYCPSCGADVWALR
jgi:hypothetical protein